MIVYMIQDTKTGKYVSRIGADIYGLAPDNYIGDIFTTPGDATHVANSYEGTFLKLVVAEISLEPTGRVF